MIEVEGLSFDYPETRALDAVGFSLAAGSITALVGPNGSGKTTLLRCLAGLEAPHEGRITLAGIDVAAEPRRAHQRLGFLPDHFGLYAELSARRCLLHAGGSRGLSGAALTQRVADIAARVGLTDKLEALAGSLSRGQRQRLALAQSILHRPEVLLLDEPASGLDPEARADLADLMRSLARDGMTLVVSSHILAELEEYCTGMLVLKLGRVLEHRATQGDAGSARLRRLRVRFASPIDASTDWRSRMPAALQSVALDAASLDAMTDVADAELPALLRALLDAGLPVCEFSVVADSLQDCYLAAVREARR